MSNKKNKKKNPLPQKSKAQIRAEEAARAAKNKKIMIIVLISILLVIAAIVTVCVLTSKRHKGHYYVEMTVENYGTVILELDAKAAPKTVKNFKRLVKQDFYDGLTFHRVIEDFMIQGGDPDANGTGGSGKTIKGEFLENGYNNPIRHERGVISMARGEDYNSASSQFFICNSTSYSVQALDGKYAAFGRVIKGMNVVDNITNVTSVYADAKSGTIYNKSLQAVITEMKLITYKEAMNAN